MCGAREVAAIGRSVHAATYGVEHMFPRVKKRLAARLLNRLDLIVEFSTLGEYGLGTRTASDMPRAARPQSLAALARAGCSLERAAACPAKPPPSSSYEPLSPRPRDDCALRSSARGSPGAAARP